MDIILLLGAIILAPFILYFGIFAILYIICLIAAITIYGICELAMLAQKISKEIKIKIKNFKTN